jgi:DNA-binding HxlR family transcriptional regulator
MNRLESQAPASVTALPLEGYGRRVLTDQEDPWRSTSVRTVLDLLEGRWVLLILAALRSGPLRRNALRQRLGSVADKVLTETLRRMEEQHLITRSAWPTVPVEVNYALAPRALRLEPLLVSMDGWAQTDRFSVQQHKDEPEHRDE